MLVKNKKGEIKEIIYDEKQLYKYGINRIKERDYARLELLTKMKKLQPDLEMINKVLDKLDSQGYISDYNRAKSLFNQFSGKESLNKTKQRILKVGVSKDTIDDVLEEITPKNDDFLDEDSIPLETQNAVDLLIKKFKNYEFLKKDKMVRFLAGKGYKYDTISKSISYFSKIED